MTKIPLHLAIGAAALAAVPVFAQLVTSTTGQIKVIPAPASVKRSGLQDNALIMAFREQQGVTLPKALPVDIARPGIYLSATPKRYTTGALRTGTKVNSYFLESNTVGVQHHSYSGTITFDTPIIGLIVSDARLDATDRLLGAPHTLYPFHDAGRGLEGKDAIVLSPDRKTISVLFDTYGAIDEVRVLTRASGSPLPAPSPTVTPAPSPLPTGTPAPTTAPAATPTPTALPVATPVPKV